MVARPVQNSVRAVAAVRADEGAGVEGGGDVDLLLVELPGVDNAAPVVLLHVERAEVGSLNGVPSAQDSWGHSSSFELAYLGSQSRDPLSSSLLRAATVD